MSEQDNTQVGGPDARPARRISPWKVLLLFVVALGVLWYVVGNVPHEPVETAVAWQSDFPQAAARARSDGKVIFADFGAGWCPPCRQMDATVFGDKSFAEALEEAAVPLRVDVDEPAGQELSRRYNVQMIPTYIVIAADGTVLARSGGVKSAAELLAVVRGAAGGAAAR